MIGSLNERERYMVTGGALILVGLLLVFGVALPYRSAMQRLDRSIDQRRDQLVEVKRLQAEYQVLKQQESRLRSDLERAGAVSPLTFLERTAGQVGGRDSLVLMRPLPAVTQGRLRIESTEFKLERLDLDQVLRLLMKIEQARPPMRVERLHIKQRFDNAAQLDMSATVSAARRS